MEPEAVISVNATIADAGTASSTYLTRGVGMDFTDAVKASALNQYKTT